MTNMIAPDAQTIAFLLQKQLEDIDNEIRLIKEEKQTDWNFKLVKVKERKKNKQSDGMTMRTFVFSKSTRILTVDKENKKN